MKEENLPSYIQDLIRDRRSLLWVCQIYDLEDGQEPHDYNLSQSEAQFRYHPKANELDQHLASFYWESVWLEGARSPLLNAIQTKSHLQSNDIKRQIVVLASALQILSFEKKG
jgi:hypothetical protein